ncbi:MAG: pseudouridine-5'-phosphate glycosidase [Chloroflexi bacterium]|nr:pseudouridine-5'-phosphate glycosidase [Chloroflexota bacterium]
MTSRPAWLRLSREVKDSIDAGRPVVALESTLVTHGLAAPDNLRAARAAEAAIRSGGATPATVAVSDGTVLVGLSDRELEALAAAPDPLKVSRQNLAAALGRRGWSGTTVAATMIAAHAAGIEVFATGGIGGVHRGGAQTLDISADLEELARTPVAVISAGPKSILDARLTLEYLETRGVPVVGWATDELPGFFTASSGESVPHRVEDAAAAAALCRRHWSLDRAGGLVFTVPPPAAAAMAAAEADRAVEQAISDAQAAGIHGPASTPWLLSRVAELTAGRSVAANLALIEHDATIAAAVAVALSPTTARTSPA